jgi:microcompartment protein CcmL/EutN
LKGVIAVSTIRSIGLIELNSIARGVESTDAMLKAGNVTLVFAKPVCPGKYIALVAGDVGAVNAAMAAGVSLSGSNLVHHLTIPRVHPDLLPAVNGVLEIKDVAALGLVEYFDITSAILGADAAAKTGNVSLMELRLGMGIGGKSYFTLCGQVSDVKAAVNAALADTEQRGAVVNSCVIPSPTPELFRQML